MKVKMSQVVEAYNWAMGASKEELPYTAAFIIASNVHNMESAVRSFEEQRKAMLDKYGKKDPEGNLKAKEDGSVELEDVERFMEEFSKLLECEAEILVNKIPTEAMAGSLIPTEKMSQICFLFDFPKCVQE